MEKKSALAKIESISCKVPIWFAIIKRLFPYREKLKEERYNEKGSFEKKLMN